MYGRYPQNYIRKGFGAVCHLHRSRVETEERFYQHYICGEKRDYPCDADKIKHNVSVCCPFRVPAGAERCEPGGNGCADVFAEDESRGRFKIYHAGSGESHSDGKCRGRGLYYKRKDAADQSGFYYPKIGACVEHGKPFHKGRLGAHRLETVFHKFQAEKDHADSHNRHGDKTNTLVF